MLIYQRSRGSAHFLFTQAGKGGLVRSRPAVGPAASGHGGPGGCTERDVVRLLGDTRWVVTGDPHDDVDGLLDQRSVSTDFAFVLHEAGTAR